MKTHYVVMIDATLCPTLVSDDSFDPYYRVVVEADDSDHAEEQALDAYPNDRVVWIDTDESLRDSEWFWFWEDCV